ncbi:MAG: hypothetical protein RR215_03420 [Ruthenibacterium sp.]
MTKKPTIAIDTGALTLPVVRDGTAVGTLVLHPEDTAFLTKFYALLPKLEQQRADLAAALQSADTGMTLTALSAACEMLQVQIDEVFGAGTSALVFDGVCSLHLAQQFFAGVAEALRTARAPKLAAYTQSEHAVLT